MVVVAMLRLTLNSLLDCIRWAGSICTEYRVQSSRLHSEEDSTCMLYTVRSRYRNTQLTESDSMCNFLFQRRGDRAFDTHRPSKRRLVQHNITYLFSSFSLLLISFLLFQISSSTQSHQLAPGALSRLIPSSSHILYTLLFPLFSLLPLFVLFVAF